MTPSILKPIFQNLHKIYIPQALKIYIIYQILITFLAQDMALDRVPLNLKLCLKKN